MDNFIKKFGYKVKNEPGSRPSQLVMSCLGSLIAVIALYLVALLFGIVTTGSDIEIYLSGALLGLILGAVWIASL